MKPTAAEGIPLTHAHLVHRACKFLRARGCAAIAADSRTKTDEQPDVIGWKPDGASVLIECKASRDDFARDMLKPHRSGAGMGRERFYLCRRGLIQPHNVPAGWGLVWVGERETRILVPAPVRDAVDLPGEVAQLVALCRRLLERAAEMEPSYREAATASDGSGL